MKTKHIIHNLRICGNGRCGECTMCGNPHCLPELRLKAADKLEAHQRDVTKGLEKIKALKKKNKSLRKEISTLKKELAEREAAPGWISVEERLPEESGYYLAYDCRGNLFICLYQANGLWDSSSVDYWMPLPEPPKKVKTYTDVFWERMKEAFPEAVLDGSVTGKCRDKLFGINKPCTYQCRDCWNQPYPEKEGGAE